jgi:hypothetical protein
LSWPEDLPLGDYVLWVGLYDPVTQQRVAVSGPGGAGDNRVLIATLPLP